MALLPTNVAGGFASYRNCPPSRPERTRAVSRLETAPQVNRENVMTTRVDPPAASIDEARHELCLRLAKAIREGEHGLQVRLVKTGNSQVEAWIYTQQHHEWKKRDDLAVVSPMVEPLRVLLEGLFHQKFSDAWTCHRTEHHDRTDYELKFVRESIDPHVKGDLESYLTGCLSHAHHDSGQDSRRRMGFRNQ